MAVEGKARTEIGANQWRLGVGHALDVLQKDYFAMFRSGSSPDLSIFSQDVELVDARIPDYPLQGLATYEKVLSALRWTISSAFDWSNMEITSMTQPVNNEVYIRWKLELRPKDMLAQAKMSLLSPFGFSKALLFAHTGELVVVEGYSKYEFDPWTAEIVKHTIEVTNPPMYIMDLLRQHAQTPMWATPIMPGAPMASI